MTPIEALLDQFRACMREIEQRAIAAERENARLARENGDQCDLIEELRQHIRELQAMNQRAQGAAE